MVDVLGCAALPDASGGAHAESQSRQKGNVQMNTGTRGAAMRLMPLLAAAVCAASGCGKTVTIKYYPLANADYVEANVDPQLGVHKAGVLMVYCIIGVDNKEAKATDFLFDVARLSVKDPHALDTDPKYAAYRTAINTLVPKGTATNTLGKIVIDAKGLDISNNGWVPLFYTTISGDSVLMIAQPTNPAPTYTPELPAPNAMPQCPTGPLP
jgi:hypothetical protein